MPREIHIHVEEPSMESFLKTLLPRHIDPRILFRSIDYGSKQQLLSRLPARMMGYARIPIDHRPLSLVLVDRDDDDCMSLKQRLNDACVAAGLRTRAATETGALDVVNRIVVEELEAWFFGDATALDKEWSGAGRVIAKAGFRDPDAIRGGTHEALLRELQRAGHLRGLTRLPKIDTARSMGALIDPGRNTSCSFQHFWTGLHSLLAIA
ncbi:DUF4276 family protein [Sphingomonas bacterium]|uniref:DUF4276 family protein n=1 Tax=Sphingomonas bacterium TaxID=1895847 RepID=UPI0026706B2B|nr:DUF4276 family protein [Sphingomonas bacterium]